MKKHVLLFALLLCICLLCSCSSKSTSPTDAMLKEDLSTSLREYAPIQEFKDFEVETSLTEENSYTATVSVNTSNEFSEAVFQADLQYTQYDQGWKIDSCNWTLSDYSVIAYPDVEYLTPLVQTEPDNVEATPSKSPFFTQQTCTSVVPIGDGSIWCDGIALGDSNKYATEQYAFTSQWVYDPLHAGWSCSNYCWSCTTVFEDLSGSWPSVHAPGETITISNFTQDGFDVRCSALKTNTVHVEKVYNPQWPTYTGTGASGTKFNGVKTENQEIIVRFSVSEDKILVSYILDKNIDEANIS